MSRSGRVRKKSSKLLDFQSPDEVEKKVYKRTTASGASRHSSKYIGRGRPSLASLKARRQAGNSGERGDIDDVALDDDDADMENESDVEERHDSAMDLKPVTGNSDEDDVDEGEDDDNLDDVLANNANLTANSDSDDGFGELVADLVGTEGANINSRTMDRNDSKVRKSLYMTEKRLGKDGGRVERKDKGKSRYTAYSLWAREYRKSSKFGKEVDFSTARRELWANVSNKDKNIWRRKAKIQATKAKALEKEGKKAEKIMSVNSPNTNSTFINRPTTSRTKKLAEDKQKAKDEMAVVKPASHSTPKRARNNSYNRANATTSHSSTKAKGEAASSVYAATNGSSTNYTSATANSTANNINMPLPTIEPIDAAAHLKLLGESLTIIGDRLKEHEGQIAVSGSLSVLLDSLLCSLGPLLCLTTNLPGLDKKPQLKANLATTLDNIAYVMPGL